MTLKEYLQENNLTCTEFAKRCKLTRNYMSLILHGRRTPSPLAAHMIQKATNGKIKASFMLDKNRKI